MWLIELYKEEKTIILDLEEEEKGHYSIEREFSEAGQYKIHPFIDNRELETEFGLEVEGFGISGFLRTAVIFILLLILILFIYKDCRREG